MLQIPRARVEDAGRYVCVAVNEAGEDSLQYDVRVLCESFGLVFFLFVCLFLMHAFIQKVFEELVLARCCAKHFRDIKIIRNQWFFLGVNCFSRIESTLVRTPEVSISKLA